MPAEVTRLHATRTGSGQEKGQARQIPKSHGTAGPLRCCWVCREAQAGGGRERLRGATCGPGQCPSSSQAVEAGHAAPTLCLCGCPDTCGLPQLPQTQGLLLPAQRPLARSLPQVPSTGALLQSGSGCGRDGPQDGRCSGRASGGGRGPAELTAHVRPRMLCLARGTNSRLTIRDSAAGKNKSFCNYMPPPKMLARTGWPWARTQPAEPAYSPCPASLTRRPQPLTDPLATLTHPRSPAGGAQSREQSVFLSGPCFSPSWRECQG